jgi:hypothetical protein
VDWPLRFSHPVIEIESVEPMSCNGLKKATLYELGIPLLEYDQEENQLSDSIVQTFRPETLDRWLVPDPCYSFDCEGGSCFDDAFSFRKTPKGYFVSIHISDVHELIKDRPYLLNRALARDQTIYLKNYYRSMFPEQLRNLMSLEVDRLRLALSLTFEMSEEGLIDYGSIEWRESTIRVVQNVTHGDAIRRKEDKELIGSVARVLGKCKEVESLMLFDEVQSATLTAQLLYLSAYLPMVAFHRNLQQFPQALKNVELVFARTCQRADALLAETKVTMPADQSNIEQKQPTAEAGKDPLGTSSRACQCRLEPLDESIEEIPAVPANFSDPSSKS